jgi:limonene-1,2-epoxide hydrolase
MILEEPMETNDKTCFVMSEEEYTLAQKIATETCVSTIECMTTEETIDGATWIDISVMGVFKPVNLEAAEEIRYLALRNLLRYHPTRPNLVQIVEA